MVFPFSVSAGHSCEVMPFSKKIVQGETAIYAMKLKASAVERAFEVKLGNLPRGLDGGFSSSLPSSAVREGIIVVSTTDDAQVGSFNIPVLYREEESGALIETACKFNLIVAKAYIQPVVPTSVSNAAYVAPAYTTPDSPDASDSIPATGDSLESAGNRSALEFAKLKEAVKMETTKLSTEAPANFAFTSSLARGQRGPAVTRLQEVLKKLGFFPAKETPTGYFGAITGDAVKAFQAKHRLEPVGSVGPKTRALLNSLNGQ